MFDFLGCPIVVPPEQMSAIVRTESSANPYAIGIVGHHLNRQPQTIEEALSIVKVLREEGYNYSVGIAQVNKVNFNRYLPENKLFDKCSNLLAGSQILQACYQRYNDWQKSYSCYYSGNSVTGFQHGYVRKVLANLKLPILTSINIPKETIAIKLISNDDKSAKTAELRLSPTQNPPSLSKRRLSSSLSNLRGL